MRSNDTVRINHPVGARLSVKLHLGLAVAAIPEDIAMIDKPTKDTTKINIKKVTSGNKPYLRNFA